ncbi:hypothetical protein Tco_1156522 [Tanacetum coccineum]
MSLETKLTMDEDDESMDEEDESVDNTKYRSMIGSLIYDAVVVTHQLLSTSFACHFLGTQLLRMAHGSIRHLVMKTSSHELWLRQHELCLIAFNSQLFLGVFRVPVVRASVNTADRKLDTPLFSSDFDPITHLPSNPLCDDITSHVIRQRIVCGYYSPNRISSPSHLSSDFQKEPSSWGIPLENAGEILEMDPYEEVAQQGQAHPLSPAYVPDPMELDEHVPVYVPEPEHPEYQAPSDDDIQVEDQPYAEDASPTAESPGYIADSDSIEDDTNANFINYPDEPEDGAEDPSKEHDPEDDDEDPEEDLNEEDEPSENSDETKPVEEDEPAATPPSPRHHGAKIFVRP